MARARSLWSGSLSFGLVNVPVSLVSAVRDQAIHFHQIHKKTHERLHVSYVCTKEKTPVDYAEIARGFDTGNGYVMLTDEELASAQPEKTRTIEISKFVALDEIDPILFDHPYYLLPAGTATARCAPTACWPRSWPTPTRSRSGSSCCAPRSTSSRCGPRATCWR